MPQPALLVSGRRSSVQLCAADTQVQPPNLQDADHQEEPAAALDLRLDLVLPAAGQADATAGAESELVRAPSEPVEQA